MSDYHHDIFNDQIMLIIIGNNMFFEGPIFPFNNQQINFSNMYAISDVKRLKEKCKEKQKEKVVTISLNIPDRNNQLQINLVFTISYKKLNKIQKKIQIVIIFKGLSGGMSACFCYQENQFNCLSIFFY